MEHTANVVSSARGSTAWLLVVVVDADPEVTRQLTAALGEILHNIAKHARASEVVVRLVVWDLDDTFWHGTLTEGGITFRFGAKLIYHSVHRYSQYIEITPGNVQR